jgi:uncharacterized protein
VSVRVADVAVTCDGIALGCSVAVPGAARGVVILLHGIPSVNPPDPDDRGYAGWAEELAAAGWLTAWADLRAVRRSKGYFSIEGWVRDALSVVDAVRGLPEAKGLGLALVGSSAGGCVAAEAVRRGAPVDALALLAAPAAWLSFAAGGPAGLKRITEEAGMAVTPEVLRDPTSWAAEFEAITTEDAIAEVRVPTLIVHGTADDVVPVEHAGRIAARARQAEVAILTGAAHQLRRDAKAREVLQDWLERAVA